MRGGDGGEAGYEETAKMVVESGLTLALQGGGVLWVWEGGVQSTAMCMEEVLMGRLDRAGIRFYRVEDVGKEVEGFWGECLQKSKAPQAHL